MSIFIITVLNHHNIYSVFSPFFGDLYISSSVETTGAIAQGPRGSRGAMPKAHAWPVDMFYWRDTELVPCFHLFLFRFVSTGLKEIIDISQEKGRKRKRKDPWLLFQRHRENKKAPGKQVETAWEGLEEGPGRGGAMQAS